MVKSGWPREYGIGFWGANGHDGIWHIALSESLVKGSLNNPVFAGFPLQNYHIGFDLLLAITNKLTGISIPTLYFQVFPIILSLTIGYLVYELTLEWTKSGKSALLATFFTYFGGSLSYVIGKGESVFWSQQAISTLINPPYAMSLIIILIGLIYLVKTEYRLKIYDLCFLGFIFGLLFLIKVYAGLLILGALLIVSVLNPKSKFLNLFLTTLIFSLAFYLPFNKISAGLINFRPFWFLETMMGLTDHVGWVKFGEAMLNYKASHNWIKGPAAYLVAFAIFIAGNFGTRLIFIKNILKNPDSLKVFMITIIFAGILIPTLFVQSGTPWNTIQFLYYSLFFSGIIGGIALSKLNTILIYIIIVLTIPTTIFTLKDVYIPSRPPAKLSLAEISALRFLSEQTDGVVLTYPFDGHKAEEAVSNPPRPLYLYVSTAYVAAYSKQQTFLEDENNLNITGYNWIGRRREIDAWYKEPDQEKARQFLSDNNIKYVYWIKPLPAQAGQRALLGETQLGLEKIFENGEVNIYMVKSNQ